MSIVMGLDQHRAQITADWLDTETGEVKRARVAPADRAGVRRFLERFAASELEVALEATTGWRFVVEELRRIGAVVHLAEPAETAGLRGPKKRAKGDRADARHLRELLMVKRLPESWIAPDHILDLRARVRLRHTLSEQRSEWQQRIQATLYHHGCPQRRGLMVGDGRQWLAAQPLPESAREQVTVALAMIDALETQIAPLDKELRAYARRQPGCRALMAHYGIGALTAVTSSPSSATARAFPPPATPSATPGSTSRAPVRSAPLARAPVAPGATRAALGAVRGRPGRPPPSAAPIATTTWHQGADRRQPRLPVGRAQAPQALLPHAARARRGGTRTRMTFPVRAQPSVTPMRRGRLPACSRRHARVDGLKRPSGRNASPSGITPSHIMSPAPEPTRVADRSKAGRPRAHEPDLQPRTRPPDHGSSTPTTRTLRLTRGPAQVRSSGHLAPRRVPAAARPRPERASSVCALGRSLPHEAVGRTTQKPGASIGRWDHTSRAPKLGSPNGMTAPHLAVSRTTRPTVTAVVTIHIVYATAVCHER